MVKHIVMWNYQEQLTAEERKESGMQMKQKLESLLGTVPGLLSIEVILNENSSSSRDIALFSELESAEALEGYQVHPAHVKAAEFVKGVTCDRICFDYSV